MRGAPLRTWAPGVIWSIRFKTKHQVKIRVTRLKIHNYTWMTICLWNSRKFRQQILPHCWPNMGENSVRAQLSMKIWNDFVSWRKILNFEVWKLSSGLLSSRIATSWKTFEVKSYLKCGFCSQQDFLHAAGRILFWFGSCWEQNSQNQILYSRIRIWNP